MSFNLHLKNMSPPVKREQNKKANREIILGAARIVFDEIGFEAANVRDIIRNTSLASGTFYNYFKTKEQVFLALHENAILEFRPLLKKAFDDASGDFSKFIYLAFLNYFTYKLRNQNIDAKSEKILAPKFPKRTPQESAISEELKSYICEYKRIGCLEKLDIELLTRACIGIAQELGTILEASGTYTPDFCAKFAAQFVQNGISNNCEG